MTLGEFRKQTEGLSDEYALDVLAVSINDNGIDTVSLKAVRLQRTGEHGEILLLLGMVNDFGGKECWLENTMKTDRTG